LQFNLAALHTVKFAAPYKLIRKVSNRPAPSVSGGPPCGLPILSSGGDPASNPSQFNFASQLHFGLLLFGFGLAAATLDLGPRLRLAACCALY
jgi:hypothetical protein